MKVVKAREVLEFIKEIEPDCKVRGNLEKNIVGYSSFLNYQRGTVTWLKSENAVDNNKQISALVTTENITQEAEVVFYCKNSKNVFFKLVEWMSEIKKDCQISATAIISGTAKIGRDVSIGHYSYIGDGVVIGNGTEIGHHVVINAGTIIGEQCTIKSNTVIGERGFGYSKDNQEYYAIAHYGRVVIGNNVDIGSCTCIDRGTLDDTIISDGVKIDNLCHIAHNVQIGNNSCIIANSMIAGSVKIGEGCYIAPSVSILNQVEVDDEALIGMGSTVMKSIPANVVCAYSPARVLRERTKQDKEKY